MAELRIRNITTEQMEQLKDVFPNGEPGHFREWIFPAGDAVVRLEVVGPADRKQSELIQYAIDMLEVAKKHTAD